MAFSEKFYQHNWRRSLLNFLFLLLMMYARHVAVSRLDMGMDLHRAPFRWGGAMTHHSWESSVPTVRHLKRGGRHYEQ